jgi:hypothetical protein
VIKVRAIDALNRFNGINIVDASDLWPVWFETPKARNVTAWGSAPGSRAIMTLSAEGAKFCVNLI